MYRTYSLKTFVGVLAALWLILFPVVCAINYQFGGTYQNKAYPLVQARQDLQLAENFVPASANGTLAEVDLGLALINTSQHNTGVGSGSPCWLWPTPQQTFGYYQLGLSEVQQSIGSYIHGLNGAFHNSSFTSWSSIAAAIDTLQSSLDNLSGCIWAGNFAWFALIVAWLVVFAIIALVAAAVD